MTYPVVTFLRCLYVLPFLSSEWEVRMTKCFVFIQIPFFSLHELSYLLRRWPCHIAVFLLLCSRDLALAQLTTWYESTKYGAALHRSGCSENTG